MNGLIVFLIVVLAAALLLFAMISAQTGSKHRRRGGSRGNNNHRTGSVDREFVARKWTTIQAMSQSTGSSLRDAVSEADKLLDYVLKNSGVRGETMGERLKNSGSRFSDINSIWQAHKLRNALAHEAEFDLVPSQAREAVSHFEQGLKDLGTL